MLLLIRVVLLSLYFVVIAVVGIVICLCRPFNPDNSRICGNLFSAGSIKILGIRLQIEGTERLRSMQPGVVVSNHQSNLDLFVLGGVIPPHTVSIGKRSLKFIPLFGQIYWLSGNIMIDRSNRDKSVDAMDQVTDAIQNHGTSIWVFAEGTRNQGQGLLPFKKGAFYMAVKAQAPIYPVCASTYVGRLNYRRWRAGTVKIQVMEPIPTAGLGEEDVPHLLAGLQTSMAQQVTVSDQQVSAMNS